MVEKETTLKKRTWRVDLTDSERTWRDRQRINFEDFLEDYVFMGTVRESSLE